MAAPFRWVRVLADREATLDPPAQRPDHCFVPVVGPLVHQQQRVGCAMEMPSPSQLLLLCLILFSLAAILWFLLNVLNFV
jgi:hypothetical protein